MKAHEIIRGVLDLIDQFDEPQDNTVTVIPVDQELPAEEFYNDAIRRFKQIAGIIDQNETDQLYANAPSEKYSELNAVTKDAGGGLNEPKHPSDIRGATISLYPYYQNKPEG